MTEITKIDLGRLPVGVPVRLLTASGSDYVLVRVSGSRRDDTWVDRVLVTSVGANAVTEFGAQFESNLTPRVLEVGSALQIYHASSEEGRSRRYAHTSAVVRITLLAEYRDALVREQDTGES